MIKDLISKSDIANYVHDVAVMEKRIYILTQTKNRYLQKAKQTMDTAKKNCRIAQKERDKAEYNLKRGEALLEDPKFRPGVWQFFKNIAGTVADIISWFCRFIGKTNDVFLVGKFLSFMIIAVLLLADVGVAFGLMRLFPAMTEWNGFIPLFIGLLILVALATVIVLIIKHLAKKRKYKRLDAMIYVLKEHSARELDEKKALVVAKDREYQLAERQSMLLTKQAEICGEAANKINYVLQKSYKEANIVPVDFRYIDCVIVLDFAFRNDLVDTVREGINYYETKVFTREVIKGIDRICTRINELTNAVNGLRRDLSEIQNSINDLYSGSEEIITTLNKSTSIQSEALATQKETLEHTKATRYATEAIQDSFNRHNRYYGIH